MTRAEHGQVENGMEECASGKSKINISEQLIQYTEYSGDPDTDEFSGDPDADEFSGDPDFFPTEMDCDQFKPRTDADHTPEKLKHLMSQMKNSCESLKDPDRGHVTGQKLLENLCNSTDELLSEGNITDDKTLSHFLNIMENSMHLIGPQLKEPVTRMETHNTFVEVAVTRNQTPPSGRVTLSTDSALFSASWETVVGESYPGFAFAALVSYKDLNSSSDVLNKMGREKSDDIKRNVTYQLNSKVVTAVVSNTETKLLSEPVTIIFVHLEERAESADVAHSCVYWDVSGEAGDYQFEVGRIGAQYSGAGGAENQCGNRGGSGNHSGAEGHAGEEYAAQIHKMGVAITGSANAGRTSETTCL
ncbi:CD97 antigen-like protein [Labeo rohita]|uniref:CD97 antigen-like protein n=1 Tax=Labeo rohita TaxID=84645 RepID=A0A498M3Z7_LABRO|nr:CD97 antigen-like protein [Labeo rohita]